MELLGRWVLLVRRVRLVYLGLKAMLVPLEQMARQVCRDRKVQLVRKARWVCRDLKVRRETPVLLERMAQLAHKALKEIRVRCHRDLLQVPCCTGMEILGVM